MMESVSTFHEIKDALGESADASIEPLLRELWTHATDDTPVAEVQLSTVEDIAVAFIESLQPPSLAVDRVLRAGRALVEVAEGTERLDVAGVQRLRQLVDRAAVEVLRATEAGHSGRRSAWLSFYAHELKNPLNTMLNALWLIRERGSDAPQAARFLELAERAVKKLEERIKDLKGLDQALAALPPGWEGRLTPKRR